MLVRKENKINTKRKKFEQIIDSTMETPSKVGSGRKENIGIDDLVYQVYDLAFGDKYYPSTSEHPYPYDFKGLNGWWLSGGGIWAQQNKTSSGLSRFILTLQKNVPQKGTVIDGRHDYIEVFFEDVTNDPSGNSIPRKSSISDGSIIQVRIQCYGNLKEFTPKYSRHYLIEGPITKDDIRIVCGDLHDDLDVLTKKINKAFSIEINRDYATSKSESYDEEDYELSFDECLDQACDWIHDQFGKDVTYKVIREWEEWNLYLKLKNSDIEIRMEFESRNSTATNYVARYYVDGLYEEREEFHVYDDENEVGYVSLLAVKHVLG